MWSSPELFSCLEKFHPLTANVISVFDTIWCISFTCSTVIMLCPYTCTHVHTHSLAPVTQSEAPSEC